MSSRQRISELEFLLKIQRVFDEGDFVATYKFALLNALADISVENEPSTDGSLTAPVTTIAEKFLEYYWPQSRPYRSVEGVATVLKQNTGPQAAVIKAIVDCQRTGATLSSVRRQPGWFSLVRKVSRIVHEMPLWKLQTVGSESEEFLYRRSEFSEDCIRLLPGVPQAFRSLHGIVLDAVRGAWIRQITRIAANRQLLGDADLSVFLFGTGRSNLGSFARVLRDHQAGRCHYCRQAIRGQGVVDHFVPWSRYPVDLGHNLVLAHTSCNGRKRDFLAHPVHLERWQASHIERGDELSQRFDEHRLPHDLDRVRAIIWWAYEQGEQAGAHVWLREKDLERLRPGWRALINEGAPVLAADTKSPPYAN